MNEQLGTDGFMGFLWGSYVTVLSDSHGGEYVGKSGVIQPPAISAGYSTLAMFCPQGERCVEILAGAGWKFVAPEKPRSVPKRAQEVYDHDAFVMDLDKAIAKLRLAVCCELPNAQPVLTPGVTRERAVFMVCATLMLRSMNNQDFDRHLDVVLRNARDLLISKNKSYGDSALNPVRVFSQASLKEQLLVRLDDKASRLARGQAAGEDVAGDMLGYLLLLEIELPVGRYSRMRASTCLRNWLGFLTLRSDPGAQWEIRQFADAVGQIIAREFPQTWALYHAKRS